MLDTPFAASRPRFPAHGIVGVAVIASAEVLLFSGNRVVASWFTPIVWTGYVLFMDALVARLTGRSYLTTARAELAVRVVQRAPILAGR